MGKNDFWGKMSQSRISWEKMGKKFFWGKCRREKCRGEKRLWGKLSCTPFSVKSIQQKKKGEQYAIHEHNLAKISRK